MKPEPLLAAFAKIERAKSQIEDIKIRVNTWIDIGAYDIVSKVNPYDPGEEIWSFIPKPLGFDLPIAIGETLHNIRTPLDQIISAVAEQHCGSADGTAFPFGKTEDIFKRALTKQKKLLPADAIDMIIALKPYKGGNDLLWAINELNRGDKHRPSLVPTNRTQAWQIGAMAVEKGGRVLIMGDRRTAYLSTKGLDDKPYVPAQKRHPYAVGEMEVVTCTPGTKFHTDLHPACQVAFGQIEVLKREPVVTVLNDMRALVERILLTFEKRFFS